MTKFLLIEHRDAGDLARVSVCDTEAEREKATLAVLNGGADPLIQGDYTADDLRELRADGWMRFEGDPPLQWVTADCVDGEGVPLL